MLAARGEIGEVSVLPSSAPTRPCPSSTPEVVAVMLGRHARLPSTHPRLDKPRRLPSEGSSASAERGRRDYGNGLAPPPTWSDRLGPVRCLEERTERGWLDAGSRGPACRCPMPHRPHRSRRRSRPHRWFPPTTACDGPPDPTYSECNLRMKPLRVTPNQVLQERGQLRQVFSPTPLGEGK